MGKVRELLLLVVGTLQSLTGALMLTVGYALQLGILNINLFLQEGSADTPVGQWLPLCVLALSIAGLVALTSGLFLLHEWLNLRRGRRHETG